MYSVMVILNNIKLSVYLTYIGQMMKVVGSLQVLKRLY